MHCAEQSLRTTIASFVGWEHGCVSRKRSGTVKASTSVSRQHKTNKLSRDYVTIACMQERCSNIHCKVCIIWMKRKQRPGITFWAILVQVTTFSNTRRCSAYALLPSERDHQAKLAREQLWLFDDNVCRLYGTKVCGYFSQNINFSQQVLRGFRNY